MWSAIKHSLSGPERLGLLLLGIAVVFNVYYVAPELRISSVLSSFCLERLASVNRGLLLETDFFFDRVRQFLQHFLVL